MPIVFFLPLLLIHNLGKEDTEAEEPPKQKFFYLKFKFNCHKYTT